MTKETPNQLQKESLQIPLTKEYQVCQSALQFPAVGWRSWGVGGGTAAAIVPPSALSISINAAGCLTCTRKTCEAKCLGISFPSLTRSRSPALNQMFITMQPALEKEKEKTTPSTELRSLTAWCDEGQLK